MGYINMTAFHRGFVSAAATALRTGIRAERLPADIAYSPGAGASAAVPDPRIAALNDNIDREYLRAARAPIGSDEERTARQAGERYKRELAELVSPPADGDGADGQLAAPTVRTDLLVKALEALLHDDGRVSQEQARAIDMVVTDLSVTSRDGHWCATAYLRVPLMDGVGRLGPVQWSLPMYGRRGTTLLLDRLGEEGLHLTRPLADRDELEDLGLNRSAANAAWNCGLPWLVAALRHSLNGSPLPPDMPDQWSDPLYLSWLEAVYTNPAFHWTSAYTRYQFVGQALINAISDGGGVATGREICQAIPRMTSTRLYSHFLRPVQTYTGERMVAPLIHRSQVSTFGVHGDGGTYQLRRCRCGGAAELAVSAPEIPSRLLCMCGRMVDAERYGMDPDLRFPEEYRLLAPDREACAEFYAQERGLRSRVVIGSLQERILSLPAAQYPEELTASEIGRALEVARGEIEKGLNRLEKHGWMQRRVPARKPGTDLGRVPSLWTVIRNPIGTDEVVVLRRRRRSDARGDKEAQSAPQ